jgi:hypothetical protein
MAITRAQQAKQMLREGGMTKKIKGQKHMLAYITPGEAETLESLGGQKTMTPEGIPAYPPPGKGASTGIGGSGGGTGKDQTGGGGGGGNNNDRDNLREQASVASTQGKKTPTMQEVREIVNRGSDDRGNFLQNRNQRNVVEYNKNLKKIENNKNLNFIEKFNAKKKLRNKQFINNKFTQKAQGIADAYGLSVDQLKDLLDSYEEDSKDQIGFFSKMQDILDMDPSARNLGQNFNEDILKGALGSIELSPRMKKGTPLSDAELFSTTDATTRIDLPGVLGIIQGDPNFSNVLSGLNRLQTLDAISQLPDVKQSDIDNYFSLTMGKGGINPLTDKPVDALFTEPLGGGGDNTSTDPCKGPNPPAYCFIGGNAPTTPDPVFTPSFRFMNRGGMVEDAPMGGIMDLESTRQMLFIGGIAKGISKAVKGVTRGLKKVAKSPLGKAALLGAVGFGIPGTSFGGLFGRASFGKPALGAFGKFGIGPTLFANPTITQMKLQGLEKGFFPKFFGNMSGLKVAGLSGLGGALLASLENKDDDDFDIEEYYRMAGIDIPENQYRFLAEGGRVGLQEGGIMPRLNQLSGDVSSAEQMLQEINQRLESAESSLGSGGSMQQLEQADPNKMIPGATVPSGGMKLPVFTGTPQQIDPAPFMRPGNIPGTDVPFSTLRSQIGNGFYDLNTGLGDNQLNVDPMQSPLQQAVGMADGGKAEPVAKKTMPLLDLDGQEMDFRAEGGFVPIGRMEKADDVPARLSKNEFVFTAEAVRNAGGGDVDKGAEVMYNTMKNLEAGGEVSEETQGLEGARKMFQTSQRLGEVV